jgi:hypothetical protein
LLSVDREQRRMTSFSGAKFGPGYSRRKWSVSAGRVWPWIVSLAVHWWVLSGMGYLGQWTNQHVGSSGTRKDEIVLMARWGERDENASPSAVSFTSATNRAPELLRPVRQPMFDAHVSLAAASVSVEEAPRAPIQATSASASATASGPAGPNATETQIFGVRSRGARFVYVFDRSASMEGGLLSAAKRELIASLHQLDSRHQFQIIFYNDQPQIMPAIHGNGQRMAFADDPGKRLAADFTGGVFADGGTNHLQALAMALSLKPDVIFFLTDAEEPQMRPEELAAVRRLNRGTQINTIEFGSGDQNPVINFLQLLAAENGGQHAYVNVRHLRR